MGPKSYEQCAGFLKIPESAEPLDNTWVHPENYAAAREIRERFPAGGTITTTSASASQGSAASSQSLSGEFCARLKEEHGIGDTTIKDIMEELKKPNRDPRDDYPKPILQKGIVSFEDLNEGMIVTGKIKNVVDFGAFVDLGIKETALVHISELSDHYVKDPMNLVKAGDVCEFRIIALDRDRKRISLSRKKETSGRENSGGKDLAHKAQQPAEGERPARQAALPQPGQRSVSVRRTGGPAPAGHRPSGNTPEKTAPERGPQKHDDGTMYNPFAEALKKMKARTEK
jgi:uncharacterized protein